MISKKRFLKNIKTVKIALEDKLITPARASELIESIERQWICDDILRWGKYYLGDKFNLPFCYELHDYLVDTATEPFTDTLAPRGHAKTTIRCVLIPLYLALEKPLKFRHFLNIQSTSTKSSAINLSIRTELEENELIIRDYGNQVTREKWTERQFVLANGTIFSAVGSGESVRGLNYRNIRPDYVMADDLYDEDSVENPAMVQKINRWFWSSIYKCVALGREVCFHITGTAINKEDLMHTLSKNHLWKFRKFQAVKDWETGDVLWPEAINIEKLREDKLVMGSIIFERELQNNVRDDSTSIIKSSYIKYYDGRIFPTKFEAERIAKENNLPEIPEHYTKKMLGIDPAEKTKELNDFTGKVAIYKTNLMNYYIFEARNDKMSQNSNLLDIKALHDRIGFDEAPFETNKAFGLFEELQRTTNVPVREVIASKDKLTRLIGVSPKFENGKVLISMLIPEAIRTELVDQLINNTPPHDDMRDAVVNCLEDKVSDFYFGG